MQSGVLPAFVLWVFALFAAPFCAALEHNVATAQVLDDYVKKGRQSNSPEEQQFINARELRLAAHGLSDLLSVDMAVKEHAKKNKKEEKR